MASLLKAIARKSECHQNTLQDKFRTYAKQYWELMLKNEHKKAKKLIELLLPIMKCMDNKRGGKDTKEQYKEQYTLAANRALLNYKNIAVKRIENEKKNRAKIASRNKTNKLQLKF
jgi:hypothetical protein